MPNPPSILRCVEYVAAAFAGNSPWWADLIAIALLISAVLAWSHGFSFEV